MLLQILNAALKLKKKNIFLNSKDNLTQFKP